LVVESVTIDDRGELSIWMEIEWFVFFSDGNVVFLVAEEENLGRAEVRIISARRCCQEWMSGADREIEARRSGVIILLYRVFGVIYAVYGHRR